MKRTIVTILALAILLGVCVCLLLRGDRPGPPGKSPLVVHCAAGLHIPVSKLAREYEQEFGIPVHLQFGGSGALESQLAVAGGDLYLPADDSYIRSTRAKGLVRESIPVAGLTAGIVVPKGNPEKLRTLGDLGRDGIRLSLADRSAAIGKLTWEVLDRFPAAADIRANVLVTKPTVNNIVEDVATGAVDATIAWDAVARSFPELEWIAIPEFRVTPRSTSIGVLASAVHPARALHFARFLSSRDRGLPIFGKAGFRVASPADRWVGSPEVTLFCQSILHPAIQERIQQFEQREGCRISTIAEGGETIDLNDPLALATQPFAVARDTEHPQLMTRLGAWLSDPSARARFEELGFTWKPGNAGE